MLNISHFDQQAFELNSKLKSAINEGSKEIILSPGEFHLRGNLLEDKYCFVSNNDSGWKRILFDFTGVDNFVLDGNGAHLIFYGEIMPIRISNSSNITIKNLTIDWHRPFFSQGIVTKTESNTIFFNVDTEKYPLNADTGRLIAYDGLGWQTNDLWNMLCYDSNRQEIIPDMPENWHLSNYHKAEVLSHGEFKIEASFAQLPTVNTPIVFMHGNRVAPGIFIDASKNIRIEATTVHHAPGMAMIAEVSENITLHKYNVLPSGDRLFSSWVDASHFVDCNGHILIENCRFEGQFDDASNIHGVFWDVIEKISNQKIRVQIIHPQQVGILNIVVGDQIALHEKYTHQFVHMTNALEIEPLNNNIYDITLETIPENIENLVIRRYRQDSLVEIKNNHFGANRGRGLLLSVPGKIIVKDNYFHVDGAAIEITSDTKYWWESGPVEDVEIFNNHFDDCGFGVNGKVLFHIGPDLPEKETSPIFNSISD